MNKITQASTPSGILAVFPIPPQPSPEQLDSGIVLAQISDPGNMGTLIRTCAAMGKNSVVVIDGADVWNPKVVQASAGTLALVTVFNWSWDELIKHKKQIPLYALVVNGGVNLQSPIAGQSLLVIGSEAHGLPEQWIQQSDERITLSMPGGTESLNAGVAGSIAMYIGFTPPKLTEPEGPE
jgi:TrmH family RNA methyltransferase